MNTRIVKNTFRKILSGLFAVITLVSSMVGVSLILARDVEAAGGTYSLECDENGGNEYIIFYQASGAAWTKWEDHAVLRIDVSNNSHMAEITINGNQTVKCKSTNDERKEFSNIDSAVTFIKWAQTTSQYKSSSWKKPVNGDEHALYWAFLNSFNSNTYPTGTIPSTENQWNMISTVICRWPSPDMASYKYLIQYYGRSGGVVAEEKYNGSENSCTDVFKKHIQTSTSPSKNWTRSNLPGKSMTGIYIRNPNGAVDSWGGRGDLSVSTTECELSANPQIDGAKTSCTITVSGDVLVNAYQYGTGNGIIINRISGNTFKLEADSGKVKNEGDTSVVMFWRAGSEMPSMGEQWYSVSGDLVKVTITRTGSDKEVGDWSIEDPEYYSNCKLITISNGPNDYCIKLSGDGLNRTGGGLHTVFVDAVSSNDSSAAWSWHETSKKLHVKLSDYKTSRLELRFCLDDADGEASDDCRTVVIGGGDAVLEPDPDTGECSDGYVLQSDGTCAPEASVPGTEGDGGDNLPKDEGTSCFNGAGSMGWIMCPLIEGLGDTVKNIYDTVIAPFLAIDAKLFDDSSGTFEVWQTFQVFANIVFIILMLIVIFSQVTGFGIDNYGIKKILPKLIIAAILINLSYIICQLAVDVSNIFGYGVREAFRNIGPSVSDTFFGAKIDTNLGTTTLVAVTAGLVGALGVASVIASGWAVLLPLLLALFSAFVAIVFVFILLGVRQAGVVLLVVLSPLAVVCYILPNTKKIFDRWLKMFQGLLILFPLAGLLIGGGDLASRIILSANSGSNDNFWMMLVALLLNVVPFFFLPTLLKNSFAAMGNIGAKISGLGTKIGKGGAARARESNFYKDNRARLAAGKAGGTREKLANSRFGRITGAQRGLARNRMDHLKQQSEINAAKNMTGTGFEAAKVSQEKAAEREQLENEIALANSKTNNGEQEGELFRMYDEAVGSGNVMRARAIAEIAGRRKDTASAFTSKLKKDTASGKYADANGQKTLQGVTKQISTGANSKQYRSSDALGFEFASQYNKSGGTGEKDYSKWVSDEGNVSSAIKNHITNGQELYGQKSSVLEEMRAHASTDDKQYLAGLAQRAQEESSQTGVYDQTKEKAMEDLQAGHTLRVPRDANNPYTTMTDEQIENIHTHPNSSPTEQVRAEQERQRRMNEGNWTGS